MSDDANGVPPSVQSTALAPGSGRGFAIGNKHDSPRFRDNTARAKNVWPAAILIFATLCPPEISFEVGTLKLFAYRVAILILLPLALYRLSTERFRIGVIDAFVLGSACWTLLAALGREGWHGFEAGGSLAVDLAGAFLIGRASIRGIADLPRLLRLVAPVVVLAGFSMLVESISGSHIIRPVVASWFGVEPSANVALEYRLGLARATGPFPHPILGGLHLSSFLPLYLLCDPRVRWKIAGVSGSLLGFFSLSSAAIIGIILTVLLYMLEMVRRRVAFLSWNALLYGGLAFLVLLQLGSERGAINILVRYLTLESWTGYYRLLIWEYGLKSVAARPLFGIGYADWVRPQWMISPSVDGHWLYLAMRDGIPAPLLLAMATVGTVLVLAKRVKRAKDMRARNAFLGLCFSLAIISTLMFTVTFWATTNAWYATLVGLALSAGKRVTKPRRRTVGKSSSYDCRIYAHHAGTPNVVEGL